MEKKSILFDTTSLGSMLYIKESKNQEKSVIKWILKNNFSVHILHPFKTWKTFLKFESKFFFWLTNYNLSLIIRETICLWSKVTKFYCACISLVETSSTSELSLSLLSFLKSDVTRTVSDIWSLKMCISRSSRLSDKCYCCSCEKDAHWTD